jgi:hypothetical protein
VSMDGRSYSPVEPTFDSDRFIERSPDARYARVRVHSPLLRDPLVGW